MIPSPLSALSALQGATQAYRLGMEASGCEALAVFLDTLAASLRAQPSQQLAASLQPWFQAVVEAQQRGDYLRVADLLEFKIAPLLVQHASNTQRLRGVA